MKRKEKPGRGIGLPILFSLIVFGILLTTAAIMAILAMLALRSGLLDRHMSRAGLLYPLGVLLLVSVVVGTVLSFVTSRVPLRPIRKIIAATNRLAEGDFSVRLDIASPPEIRRLSDSFNRMAEELGGIEVLRSDFVNNFSHEFKTPIVSIKGFAEVLKDDGLPKEAREEYLDIIINESGRLASLATSVLNLSKVENQMILTDRAPFDLAEQIRRCILLFERRWEEMRVDLDVELEELWFCGDAELLSQIWINLMDNAIKYTPEGGRISIRLLERDGGIAVAISDSVRGISAEAEKHIFDKFYQEDTSHAAAGNGLGLTVAKRIAELHGGTIACESRPGSGTTFTVRLPKN